MNNYTLYPAVDEVTKEFPPEVRRAIAGSTEVKSAIDQGGDEVLESLNPRISSLEALGGLSPDSPTDGQTANLIGQEGTLTNAAVDLIVNQLLSQGLLSKLDTKASRSMYEPISVIGRKNWAGPIGDRIVLPTHEPAESDGQVVHPSVEFVPEGFGGYQYWMAYTPYKDGDDAFEDPCVAASHDGTNWVIPSQAAFPLDDAPGGTQFNSDTNILYDDGLMYVFWRLVDTRTSVRKLTIYYSTSSDGQVWSDKAVAHESSLDDYRLMAPSFQRINGRWYLWAVDNAAPDRPFLRFSSDTLGGTWGDKRVCSTTLEPNYQNWHITVKLVGQQYIAMLNDTLSGGNGGRSSNIYLMTSSNGINWDRGGYPLVPRIGPNHNDMYAATFVVSGEGLDVWYSAIDRNPSAWYIYRSRVTPEDRRQPFATLDGTIKFGEVPANGGKATVVIDFPPGHFTAPPRVMGVTSNGRLTVSKSSTPNTKDSAEINLFNFTSGNAGASTLHWFAIQQNNRP